MTYIAILVFIFLAWLIFKIYQFLKMGGTFTLVTRNVCFLYYQAKLVYPKLNEDDAIRLIIAQGEAFEFVPIIEHYGIAKTVLVCRLDLSPEIKSVIKGTGQL